MLRWSQNKQTYLKVRELILLNNKLKHQLKIEIKEEGKKYMNTKDYIQLQLKDQLK